jgi:hypothetical protein
LIKRLAQQYGSRSILLLDGIGAFVSFVFLGIVFVQWDLTGMPPKNLYYLAGIALLFTVLHFLFYTLFKTMWLNFLFIMICANTLYALISLVVLVEKAPLVTWMGWVYFCLEIIILLLLVRFEIEWFKRFKYS